MGFRLIPNEKKKEIPYLWRTLISSYNQLSN